MISFNNKVITSNNIWLNGKGTPLDPYNPLNLSPGTVRVRTDNAEIPLNGSFESVTLVTGTTDVYDVYKSGDSFVRILYDSVNVKEILGANTKGITNMTQAFYDCHHLANAPLFDTSSVTRMDYMFGNCFNLEIIPLYNTNKVTNMYGTFAYCYSVKSGALALYNQASTQANPPIEHEWTFKDCGIHTETGLAELNQIPVDWGGKKYINE